MKVLLLLSTLFLLTVGVPIVQYGANETSSYYPVEVFPGVFKMTKLTGPIPHVEAVVSDIQIYFYSTNNKKDAVKVDLTKPAAVSATSYSSSKPTVFVVHGWTHKYSSASCQDVKNALLTKHDVNVFIVDWNKISRLDYPTAFAAVKDIGNLLGSLIKCLVKNNGLSLDKTTIVGHSLGGQIAGVAGKALDGKVDSVVGLDPAGPLFLPVIESNRVTTASAKFVHIIHTDGSTLGYALACGHADYYPNGGLIQRGCELDLTGICSHYRAYKFYAESIISGKFKARKCLLYTDYLAGLCNNNAVSNMGQFPVDKTASGTYFLNTNILPPYAKG